MSTLLKKTLVFIISVAMVFTVTSVSFAADPEGQDEVTFFVTDQSGENYAVTDELLETIPVTTATAEDPWYYNKGEAKQHCFYGSFYPLVPILNALGIDSQNYTGISAIASDGFVSSYDGLNVNNIYVYDMSQVYEIKGETTEAWGDPGTFGAGYYDLSDENPGSVAGNKWAGGITSVRMSTINDFAEAKLNGKKNYETLAAAISNASKGASITLLNDASLDEDYLSTDDVAKIDLNGHNLSGSAIVTGSGTLEIVNTGSTGTAELEFTPESFNGEVTGLVPFTHEHSLIPVAEVPSTCSEEGLPAYWECETCGGWFSDETGATMIDEIEGLPLDPDNHSEIVKVEAVAATCQAEGTEAYWKCKGCEKMFSDEAATKEIEAPAKVAKVDHNWVANTDPAGQLKNGSSYEQCSMCQTKRNETVIPGTAPYYVKSLKVSKGKKAFTVKWKKQSKKNQKKFNGYQVRYATKADMSDAKTVKAAKSSKSKKVKKLAKKTKYYVQVRTFTKANGTTFYSKWSAKKVVKTK